MNVLIIEDEVMAQSSLIRMINQNCPDFKIIGITSSVKDTVEWLKENSADIIFMDVELADGECFEIFRQTEVKAKVIMTTAYDSYAIKAFEAGSVDYLLKPIDPQSFKRAVDRCRSGSNLLNVESLMALVNKEPANRHYRERFIVKLNDRIVPVNTSEIAYFFSEDKNNYLVTYSNQKYVIDASLDVTIEDLDPNRFFKISRQCIIALDAIQSIIKLQGSRLRIEATPESSFEMNVSRSRVDDFLLWIEK